MLALLSRLDRGAARLMSLAVFVASVLLASLVVFMVIARYVFAWSIIGLDEIALISAMWLYMIGAIVASRRAEHLVVDFVPQRLTSPFMRSLHQRLVAAIMVATTIFFMFLSWEMLQFSLRLPQTTPGLDIPELIPKSAVMLASVGCFLYALRDLITGRPCHNPKEEE